MLKLDQKNKGKSTAAGEIALGINPVTGNVADSGQASGLGSKAPSGSGSKAVSGSGWMAASGSGSKSKSALGSGSGPGPSTFAGPFVTPQRPPPPQSERRPAAMVGPPSYEAESSAAGMQRPGPAPHRVPRALRPPTDDLQRLSLGPSPASKDATTAFRTLDEDDEDDDEYRPASGLYLEGVIRRPRPSPPIAGTIVVKRKREEHDDYEGAKKKRPEPRPSNMIYLTPCDRCMKREGPCIVSVGGLSCYDCAKDRARCSGYGDAFTPKEKPVPRVRIQQTKKSTRKGKQRVVKSKPVVESEDESEGPDNRDHDSMGSESEQPASAAPVTIPRRVTRPGKSIFLQSLVLISLTVSFPFFVSQHLGRLQRTKVRPRCSRSGPICRTPSWPTSRNDWTQ